MGLFIDCCNIWLIVSELQPHSAALILGVDYKIVDITDQLCCFLQSDGEDAHQGYVLRPEGWEEAAGPAGEPHWHCTGEFVYVCI